MKEEFFSRFKNYDEELEKVLDYKDFSEDIKNLLLSMFYKLELSYDDYYIVKRNVKTKQEYLENIINNIQNCRKMELVKINDNDFDKFKNENIKYVDLRLKEIRVLENELDLLSAILELNNFQININDNYKIIKKPLEYLFNYAYYLENIEVLRDFNAWSWNIQIKETKDIIINLIYQNLKMILNIDLFQKLQCDENKQQDVIESIIKKITEEYSKELAEKVIKLILKVAVLIFVEANQDEIQNFIKERKLVEKELEEISNKKEYIDKISNSKKSLIIKLNNINLVLTNKELLVEEFNNRNKKLSDYNQIFSLSHLVEILQKEKNDIINEIKTCDNKIKPRCYLKNKQILQDNLEYLANIENINDFEKEDIILKIQKLFINKFLSKRTDNSETKEELLECMYQLRYYIFLPYNNKEFIHNLNEIQKDLMELMKKIIKKMYDKKILNTISTNEVADIEIVCNIFELKIINMEHIYLELNKVEKENYILKIYDEKETLEKELNIKLQFNKKDKIKLKRKVKLFI